MNAQVELGGVRDESGRLLDQIRLVGISARGHHGVLAHERRDGQEFRVDVVLHTDTRPAGRADDLSRTTDYGVVAGQVAAVLGGDAVDLVETLAERIAAAVLEHPAVCAVDVVVHKPEAPITVPFDDVVVMIRRDRTERPDASGAPPAVTQGVTEDVTEDVTQEPGRVPDRLDTAPDGPVDVVLAIGANLGDAQATLRQAVVDLEGVPGLEIEAVSPLARTAPVGGPGQPDFVNAVVLGRTTLAPRALLRACQGIEARHGRERAEHWGPRTLDIDLVVVGSVIAVTDDLELPHPRAHQRAFVLKPWSLADPGAVLPGLGGGPVAALAATAPDLDGIRWMALDWLAGPEHRVGQT